MQQPLLHPLTAELLQNRLRDLPQALIITGKAGTGTLDVARHISSELQSPLEIIVPKKRAKDGKSFEPDPENGRIITDDVRALYDSVRGVQSSPRVFILQHAHKMMPTAQHALLKLLEEPTTNVHFILETDNIEQLKLTVRSRAQVLHVLPITEQQTNDYLDRLKVTDPTKRRQLQFIAMGLPAELQRLTNDVKYFESRAQLINDARQLLQADPYDKIIVIQKYQANREKAMLLIDSALRIAHHSVTIQPQQGLITQLDKLLVAKENISSNYNVRLQLLQSVL